MYTIIDQLKGLIHGVRNRETVKLNMIITVVGIVLGLIFGFFYELGYCDGDIASLLGFSLLMALVGGSFITFVINFFKRWWLIVKFGLDKEDMGWILGCICFGGLFAMVFEGVLAIFKTIKTLIFDTVYLLNNKYENVQ